MCNTVYASEQFDEWNSDAPALYTLIGYVETVTDPSYEPDDEMLEYGRLLRDHMLDGSLPDYAMDQFDDYYNRAFAGMTLEELDDFVTRMLLREADGFEGMTYAEAFFAPMAEVVDYLQKNEFEMFVC